MNGIACAFQCRVATDPEIRFLPDGKPVLSFSAIVFDAKATETTPPEWIRVSVWDAAAERLEKTLKKGGEAYVEGRLKLNAYVDKEGKERSGLVVSAWTCQPFGAIGKKAPRRDTGPAADGPGIDQYRTAFDRRQPAPAGKGKPPWE